MFERLDEKCRRLHEMFSHDHDRLRRQLMASLGETAPTARGQAGRSRTLRLIRSMRMTNRWTKISVAAAVLIAVGVGVFLMMDKTATTAYAIEQTLAANEGVRFIHIRMTPSGDGIAEAWAQFNDDGSLDRLRMDFPKTGDGVKVVLWQQGEAQVWLKDKNALVVVREPAMLAKMGDGLRLFDPKGMMQLFRELEAAGEATIETQEPAAEGEPIVLTVRSEKTDFEMVVCDVDPESKLITKMDRYRRDGEQLVVDSTLEYLDYNRADPVAFNPEIPEDVMVVDQVRDIGMEKGDMTDEAVAEEVVRQFFQALVGEDYDAAGILLEGVPGEAIRKEYGQTKFLRVISVGPAEPLDRDRGPGAMKVPCQVEIQGPDGQPMVKDFSPWVRGVYNQPARRVIFGNM